MGSGMSGVRDEWGQGGVGSGRSGSGMSGVRMSGVRDEWGQG